MPLIVVLAVGQQRSLVGLVLGLIAARRSFALLREASFQKQLQRPVRQAQLRLAAALAWGVFA